MGNSTPTIPIRDGCHVSPLTQWHAPRLDIENGRSEVKEEDTKAKKRVSRLIYGARLEETSIIVNPGDYAAQVGCPTITPAKIFTC